ncbi:hypothetical protein ALI144C_15625 [Actinosynnema sp. ALI-1.44]|uniref:hypothetical protein n=1 Tax=Actinosynnema sp. ALI-1.44 TaxID=1933779 RepID=UPI00097C70B9|nr:hypothetical protein [Actinosynnema sp. ALI-1.44]ONI84123.1 hypothetical protein ALI144C_15625 [Actinosynnema sp. ALI-1.44]
MQAATEAAVGFRCVFTHVARAEMAAAYPESLTAECSLSRVKICSRCRALPAFVTEAREAARRPLLVIESLRSPHSGYCGSLGRGWLPQ